MKRKQPQFLLLRSLLLALHLILKFTESGRFVRAFYYKVRWFFESRLMQTCSRMAPPLPSPLSEPLNHLNNELVYYRDQVLNILELQQTFISRRGDVNIVLAVIVSPLLLLARFDDPLVRRNLEILAPSFLEWFQWVAGTKNGLSKAVRSRITDYRKSRSILAHTPTETSWRYKAEVSEKKVPLRPPPG